MVELPKPKTVIRFDGKCDGCDNMFDRTVNYVAVERYFINSLGEVIDVEYRRKIKPLSLCNVCFYAMFDVVEKR